MSPAQRQATFAIACLFAMQLLWHGVLFPAGPASGWLLAGLYALPILPAVILLLLRHRRAAYWGAVAALLYFCHGVMEAWANPPTRLLALAETGIAVWLIVAYGWDGLRARMEKGKAPAADV